MSMSGRNTTDEGHEIRMFTAVSTLMNGAQYDARRRFDILSEEISHFLRYLRFRIGPSTRFGEEEEEKKEDPFRKPYDSQQAFLVRLGHAGVALQKESAADGGEANLAYERFKSCWLDIELREVKQSALLREKQNLLRQQVLWISKIVTKASVIAERLGELHDRLQQFLQRTNPDHPEPTLRRRLEHGLADKYLSELTRWVHKDIAQFCSRSYAGKYPTEYVPSTFQFWGYGHVSSHHSFVTLEEHNRDQKDLPPNAEDSLNHPRFTTVAFSYWIPERPALAPLIGHEIARQVLRAIYGRNTQSFRLEKDQTALGETYRSLVDCAEKWLAESVRKHEVEAVQPMQLATSVLSDALAATRFGWSYAYALALQIMSDERFAALFEDSSGMILRASVPPPFDTESRASETTSQKKAVITCKLCKTHLDTESKCPFCSEFEERDKDAKIMSSGLKAYPPLTYYRGRSLLNFLKLVHPVAADPFAQELNDSFECLLDAVLNLFTGDEPDRTHHARQFANSLADSLCQTSLWTPSRFVHNARIFLQRTPSSGDHANFFNLAMARQTLSPSFRFFLSERLDPWIGKSHSPEGRNESKRQAFSPECSPGLVDVVWRIEWLVASNHKIGREGDPILASAQTLRRRSREVLAVGIDDYLFRTGSPTTLFETLNEGQPAESFSELLRDHNKLDSMEGAYSLDALTELDMHLRQHPDQAFKFEFQGKKPRTHIPVVVPHSQLQWLPDRIVDTDWHNRWLDGPREALVHESIVILDLLCIKTEVRPTTEAKDKQGVGRSRALAILEGDLEVNSSKSSKYDGFASGALLGRYDAFVFYTQSSTDPVSHTSAEWRWDINYKKSDRADAKAGGSRNSDILTAYVSRTKRLVRIWGEKKTQLLPNPKRSRPSNSTWPLIEDNDTLGLVLVSLKWDASRTLVARWLARHVNEKDYGLDWAVFLSDGWEDLVIVVGVPKGFSAAELPEKYEKFVAFVEELNRSPFVSSTETLFSQELLQAPPSGFSFRFTVRLGRHQHQDVLGKIKRLSDEYVAHKGTVEVRNVAGNRDIDVLVRPIPSETVAPDLADGQSVHSLQSFHLEMRRELSGYAKFETRVAWDVR